MERLELLFGQTDLSESGNIVVIGTVKRDIYDVGKQIVVTLLKNAGFRVIGMKTMGGDSPCFPFDK